MAVNYLCHVVTGYRWVLRLMSIGEAIKRSQEEYQSSHLIAWRLCTRADKVLREKYSAWWIYFGTFAIFCTSLEPKHWVYTIKKRVGSPFSSVPRPRWFAVVLILGNDLERSDVPSWIDVLGGSHGMEVAWMSWGSDHCHNAARFSS